MQTAVSLKVADEVFLIVARLHQENPDREEFRIAEIMDAASKWNLTGALRPGVEVHIRQHCVANLPPNPGSYRMLYGPSTSTRRLLLPGDIAHPARTGKQFPMKEQVDEQHWTLIDWAIQRFGVRAATQRSLSYLLSLEGSGAEIWKDEPSDAYMKRLRDEWQ